MTLSKIYKNTLLTLAACLVLTACATKKEVATTDAIKGQMQSDVYTGTDTCLLYTSPSPRDGLLSRMPSSA